MPDRRRANRFVLPERVHGSLRVMEDVFVERVTFDEITIVMARPPAVNEELLLEIAPHGGRRRVLPVLVARGGPVGPGETTRHRATLVPAGMRCFALDAVPAGLQFPGMGTIGILVRRIPMSLREVSARGCLIESRHVLPEGTVGVLEITMPEGRSTEQVRVCRMARIVGGAFPCAAGAEFLPLGPPTPASVRNLIARLEMVLELDSQGTLIVGDEIESPGDAQSSEGAPADPA